jgi:hypothetical protein
LLDIHTVEEARAAPVLAVAQTILLVAAPVDAILPNFE